MNQFHFFNLVWHTLKWPEKKFRCTDRRHLWQQIWCLDDTSATDWEQKCPPHGVCDQQYQDNEVMKTSQTVGGDSSAKMASSMRPSCRVEEFMPRISNGNIFISWNAFLRMLRDKLSSWKQSNIEIKQKPLCDLKKNFVWEPALLHTLTIHFGFWCAERSIVLPVQSPGSGPPM